MVFMDKIIDVIMAVTKKDKEFIIKNMDTENMWDSLTRVEIILTIEDEFNIMFEEDEVGQLTTVNKLIEIVESKE